MLDTGADELLAVRCQLGERAAFDELIVRWHVPLWRYLRRLSGNDDIAGDLAQESWVRILRGLSSLRDASRLRPWIFGIARRVAMDRLREQYMRNSVEDASIEAIAAPAADEHLESDLAALEAGLAALPPRERETLALFYLRELTIEQMAVLLEVPAGTVKSRLFRARELLRRELNPGDDR
jgi:RNA polymerase sigma-70 factor (ECF subfamily)